jgi:hypothetical protein
MNRLVTLTALACAAALAAYAAQAADKNPAALEVAFKNTVVSTYPDGRTGELWLSSDGTYKAMGRRKDRSDGHWTLKGDKVCLRQSHPLAVPFTYCAAIRSGGVGTSWDGKAVTGEKVHIKIVAGRAGA